VKYCKAEKFSKKEIIIRYQTLSGGDLQCFSRFLIYSSHKQWAWINLQFCYIQDTGFHIIHNYLKHCFNLTITKLWLTNNGLTKVSSSLISELVINCKVEELDVSGNHTIGDGEELYNMLIHPLCVLKRLFMVNISLSSSAATALFEAVKNATKLEWLDIINNAITDDVAFHITRALTINKSLVKLYIRGSTISGETIIAILQAVRGNNSSIQDIYIPLYPPSIMDDIKEIVQQINAKRNQEMKEILTVRW